MILVVKTHIVEDEELGFGAEVDRVGDTRELQVTFGALGQGARVEPVALAGDRVNHVSSDAERRAIHELIDPEPRDVGDQQHVRLVDRRPAAQTRRVKAEAGGERIFGQLANRERQVMPRAKQVGEAQVYELRLGVGSKFQNIFGIHCFLLVWIEIPCKRSNRCRATTRSASSLSPSTFSSPAITQTRSPAGADPHDTLSLLALRAEGVD